MASVRSLKKDIDFLMSLVLQDCITVLEKYPEGPKEEIMEIARQIIQDHRTLRSRVMRREMHKHQDQPGKYLTRVVEEMYALAGSSLDRLNAIAKKQE